MNRQNNLSVSLSFLSLTFFLTLDSLSLTFPRDKSKDGRLFSRKSNDRGQLVKNQIKRDRNQKVEEQIVGIQIMRATNCELGHNISRIETCDVVRRSTIESTFVYIFYVMSMKEVSCVDI